MRRRDFIAKSTSATIATFAGTNSWASKKDSLPTAGDAEVSLGMDAHAVRAMQWHVSQLIDYAHELKMDSLLLNGLNYFERPNDDDYLLSLKKKLSGSGVKLYFGVGGLSINSPSYSPRFGTPKELVRQGIRLAKFFDAPSVNCRIGSIRDRYTDGGIMARMEEIIQVLRSMRPEIADAGIKFAVENHAGDMRSEELLQLVETAGTDICGVMLDPGNSVWAMENPMQQIELLGEHVLCTSIRDYRLWPSAAGATFQWTAIGGGSMDFKLYTQRMAELCPGAPFHIETISGDAREIPFLDDAFWQGYPDLKACQLLDFFQMLRKGKPIEPLTPPEGADPQAFAQDQQKEELRKSIDYLQSHCPAVKGYKG